MTFYVTTKKGKRIAVTLLNKSLKAKDLRQYENPETVHIRCKNGCKNHKKKWCCPPYAPSYTKFTGAYPWLTLILLSADYESFNYISSEYFKKRAAVTILRSRANQVLRELEQDGAIAITTGSCNLCHPCRGMLGEGCRYPQKMRYSFEGLGIDEEKLVNKIFGVNEQAGRNYFVVVGLLSKSPVDEADILKQFQMLQ